MPEIEISFKLCPPVFISVTFMDNGPYAKGLENGSDDFVDRLRSDRTSLANQEQGLMEVLIDQWKAM